MGTSLSTNSLSRSSFLRSRGSRAMMPVQFVRLLEAQAAFARRIGERLDAAVIEIAAAIEDHLFDALLLGALGDQLADRLGGGDAGAGLQSLARRLFQRRRRHHRGARIVVDHLRVDVLRGAEHGQALALARRAPQRAAHAPLPPHNSVACLGHRRLRYFFLPSLRKMRSPAYLMPLPL